MESRSDEEQWRVTVRREFRLNVPTVGAALKEYEGARGCYQCEPLHPAATLSSQRVSVSRSTFREFNEICHDVRVIKYFKVAASSEEEARDIIREADPTEIFAGTIVKITSRIRVVAERGYVRARFQEAG